MNNKIKELADEAAKYSATMFLPTGKDGDALFVQKFAELIIKECSKVIKNGGYWSGGPVGERKQCTPPEIAKMIEEHFGIKS